MAARFDNALRIELDRSGDKQAAILTEPLIFVTSWGYKIAVPDGFRSDLASIPRLGRVLLDRMEGDTASAAVVHDYLYTTHIAPRWMADGIFYEALAASGSPRWKRFLMWVGVRIGGLRGWRADYKFLSE